MIYATADQAASIGMEAGPNVKILSDEEMAAHIATLGI